MCMGMNKCVITLVMRMSVLVRRVCSMMMIVVVMVMNMTMTHDLCPRPKGVLRLANQASHRRFDSHQRLLMNVM